MTSGFVLIAAILILGGVIATAGDRIGMRVGKARLSLFNLRPRQTATLITILTGGVISASTLGLLFAISEQLRTGVFELGEIQDELNTANEDLSQTQTNLEQTRRQKSQVEQELSQAQSQREAARNRLRIINRSLQAAIRQEAETEQQLQDTRSAFQQIQADFQQAQQRLQEATRQSAELQGEIDQLQQERETQETRVVELDQELSQRERQLMALGRQQAVLERQRAALLQEVQVLEQEIQALREGDVVLFNNQVLAVGVLRVDNPTEAQQAIDQILRQANQTVLQTILPSVAPLESQVVKIRSAEVEEVIRRISNGQPHIVQILSGGNYLIGEPCVISGQPCIDVSANAVPNDLVFESEAIIGSVTIDPNEVNSAQLQERLELLIAASQLRARQAGVLTRTVQVEAEGYDELSRFLEDLQTLRQSQTEPFVIQAMAADDIFTIGPLALKLTVLQNNQPVLGGDLAEEDPEEDPAEP
ncbi:MAG: DUF3084 domain-containing protein [Elainellaceae cyanobacterium]